MLLKKKKQKILKFIECIVTDYILQTETKSAKERIITQFKMKDFNKQTFLKRRKDIFKVNVLNFFGVQILLILFYYINYFFYIHLNE